MRRGFGSFGILALVVVLAIVLVLVARSWTAVAPAAAAPESAREMGDLPNLDETRARTDEHAKQVGEALSAIE